MLALAVLGASCSSGPQQDQADGTWTEISFGPLSPRASSLLVWTGDEVLVIGGADDPGGSTNPSLDDGAAWNPTTDAWRRIADAPMNVASAPSAVVDGQVFLWMGDANSYPTAGTLLRYDLEADAWDQPTSPPLVGFGAPELVASPYGLIAAPGPDLDGTFDMWLRDPSTAEWTALPVDPLQPSQSRQLVWMEEGLLLIDTPAPSLAPDMRATTTTTTGTRGSTPTSPSSLTSTPVSPQPVPRVRVETPSLVRAATLDLSTMRWTVLEAHPAASTDGGDWLATGGLAVNPGAIGKSPPPAQTSSGSSDPRPVAAVLDVDAEEWRAVDPPPVAGRERHWLPSTVGDRRAFVHTGVFDLTTERWSPLDLPSGLRAGDYGVATMAIWAGDRLFVWGGFGRDEGTMPGEGGDLWNDTGSPGPIEWIEAGYTWTPSTP